jgi:uncharacterized membrane protein
LRPVQNRSSIARAIARQSLVNRSSIARQSLVNRSSIARQSLSQWLSQWLTQACDRFQSAAGLASKNRDILVLEARRSNQSLLQRTITGNALKLMVLGALILGITLRVVHLDRKFYWLDEAFTSQHVSGYTDPEIIKSMSTGIPMPVRQLDRYQYPNPAKTATDTISHIADTAPELPPLYFLILRAWDDAFGHSIVVTRSLSVLMSLLLLPAVYWLCWELFQSAWVGTLALALMAVSPFHIVFAQEARPYTLWLSALMLANAALVKAQRQRSLSAWVIYGLAMSVGFYTHMLSIGIWLAQTLYIWAAANGQWRRSTKRHALSSLAIWAAFTPWLWRGFIAHSFASENLVRTPKPLWALVKGILRGVCMLFVDFGVDQRSAKFEIALFLAVCIPMLLLVGWAVFYLWQQGPRLAKLFLLPFSLLPILGLLATDLLMHANRTEFNRYSLPSYLGLQIVVAYFFAAKLQLVPSSGPPPPHLDHKRWQFALAGVLAIGILSSTVFSMAPSWWNKGDVLTPFREYQCVTTAINQSSSPRMVSDAFFVHVLALSHSLKDAAEVQVLPAQGPTDRAFITSLSNPTRSVFIYLPSPALHQAVQAQVNLREICPNLLWQVQP